jgi:HK97 family phage portal protein
MKIPFTDFIISRTKNDKNSMQPFIRKSEGLFKKIYQRPDVAFFFMAYERNSDVRACVRERADGAAAFGYRFYDRTDKEEDAPENVKMQMEELINPNRPLKSFRQIKKRIVRDLSICGNAYCYLRRNLENTRIVGLDPIHPITMSIVSDSHGNVLAYVQRAGMNVRTYDPAEIIHFQNGEDTSNEVFGESPLMGVDVDIKADIEAARTNFNTLENDALPAAHFILRDDMSAEQIQVAMERIKEAFGGENKGKSGVLPDVKDIKIYERDFSKLQFLDMRKFTTDKVCAALGVPKFKIGYTEMVNNNNGEELTKNFYNDTIRPIDDYLEEVYTLDFFPRVGGERWGLEINPQLLGSDLEERALKEFTSGALTLRQYKLKTGQKITPEDEANPNIDAHIIQGGSNQLLEDVQPAQEPDSQNNTNSNE